MEDLTKQQLILLALLVSFVTSIAASIATAALLDQAPPRVTQTIHRVVERTVETVTPSDTPNEPPVVTQEKTVIVREEDAITDAIADVSPSIVRLYLTEATARNDVDDSTGPELSTRFRGLAVIVASGGKIATPSQLILDEIETTYEVVLADGTHITATMENRHSELGVTILTLSAPADVTLPDSVTLGDNESLRLGQTVIGLGGRQSTTVSSGIISHIATTGEGDVTSIRTNIFSDTIGMPIVNLFGEIVGFAATSETNTFVPAINARAVLQSGS